MEDDISRPQLITIKDWRALQKSSEGLTRLLNLVGTLDTSDPAWISVATAKQVEAQWNDLMRHRKNGAKLPLLGVPFAVKDNIDADGFATTAACPEFAYYPIEDASCVQLLKAEGAILVGKTNLDAFATGLVGTRSPYGAVPNTFDERYVSGGSSSGSASVVARGIVPFALGTDTAGSGRVPAGLNNIVGLKGTKGALSTRGVLPACRSLDCVTVLALTLEDATTVFDIAAKYDEADAFSRQRPATQRYLPPPGKNLRIAICENPPHSDALLQRDAYVAALKQTYSLPWTVEPVDFSALFKLANLLYEGPWVAERYAAIQDFINRSGSKIDPIVRGIIERAKEFSAVDFFHYEYLKADLIRTIEVQFKEYDAILVPTTPTFPTLEEVRLEPILENARLGTYTNFVNFMDWTALSIPAGFRSDGLPFGLTLISTRWQEPKLAYLGKQWLSLAGKRRVGALNVSILEDYVESQGMSGSSDSGSVPLAVVGAHISGQPLNYQLTDLGASLRCWSQTSLAYRLYELPNNGGPRKPGLFRIRDGEVGAHIDMQIWNMPSTCVGTFMDKVPSPLTIGSIELIDGSWVKGFVCESWVLSNATDITSFRGWLPYLASLSTSSELNAGPFTSSTSDPLFKAVLVANRGEIAVRIISTLKKLKIKAISIYSKEDRQTQHVRDADASHQLPEGTTYVSEHAIIKIAKDANADAVIPGYGFLSESATFAELCEANGVTWIGPTPQQMRDLGLKACARQIAEDQEIPLLPGTGLLHDVSTAITEAERIGYPVMVKSNSGGGGIGLQQCWTPKELESAVETVTHLGQSHFNDGSLFIERYIENARHIEVQIIGDGKGEVYHAGDRDCSLQRRKQKVIEESPAVFVPNDIRESILQTALKLTASVKYRGVGTVEFIYDVQNKAFYFLEVNTRLQVEHPVTEATNGIDLVEIMLEIGANRRPQFFDRQVAPKRIALEARIYGESPLQNFRPSPGLLTHVSFPPNCRVDTWVQSGTQISPMYDPLLAKLIVTGYDRPDAVRALAEALENTVLDGIETNIKYLRSIVNSGPFQTGEYNTTFLETFQPKIPAFEVIEPGPATTVQDFPGRKNLWHAGIPPSGPMDDYSFRIANRLLGNEADAAGLECTSSGPSLMFHADTRVAIVGGAGPLTLDNVAIPYERPILISAGQKLTLGQLSNGARAYIAFQGGISVNDIMDSKSTFAMGGIGGHCGRVLRHGDVLYFPETLTVETPSMDHPLLPPLSRTWTLHVIAGPHGAPDFFTPQSFEDLLGASWKVHYNSNRVGVRLTGPKPSWARETGGEAGLHPSNIHDSPYSIGSISFTGDEAVILTCDGPSLGGFVVFAVIVEADMWKVGQMKPGDDATLLPITFDEATKLNEKLENSIQNLIPAEHDVHDRATPEPVIGHIDFDNTSLTCRQAGDRAVLLEFGSNEFTIENSIAINELIQMHSSEAITGVLELTPGVRTLHIIFDSSKTSPQGLFEELQARLAATKDKESALFLPSRVIHLPLAVDHETTRAAIDRYARGIRAEAPWLPSNTSFLQRVNGLPEEADVPATMFSTTYLVLGLGDVFCGSPCAIPLDPRQRLFSMKYNPSRSWTAEGTIGIGGQYLCIYAIDSPGGYQLVGRTARIWDRWAKDRKSANGWYDEHPWLFRLFDQIRFYPIEASILDEARANRTDQDLIRIEEQPFDVKAYQEWLKENASDIEQVHRRKWELLEASDLLAEAMLAPPENSSATSTDACISEEQARASGAHIVQAEVSGKCWKISVKEADVVEKDQELFSLEAMKMEIQIRAPFRGRCSAIFANQGVIVDYGDPFGCIRANRGVSEMR